MASTTATGIHRIGLVCGVDVDAEVSRMGGPVPPMFWLRDPTGHSLIVVEQP